MSSSPSQTESPAPPSEAVAPAALSLRLREPLSILTGYLEMLLADEMPDPRMVHKALLTMKKHADRLGRMVDDMAAGAVEQERRAR